jgi:mono/diheme cytochrome c family protein
MRRPAASRALVFVTDDALRLWRGIVAVLAVTMVAAGCTSAGDDPGPPVPVQPSVIYAQMCARCHGVNGDGDPELKKTLPVRDFTDAAFQARASTDDIARVIMTGKGQMPAFGASLSAPKIQALSGHVKRLGKKPQPN